MAVSYGHVFQEKAQYEFDDTTDWYRERSKKASENFANEIFQAVDLICSNPQRWHSSNADFREFILAKFPYTIVYSVDESKKLVMIISVFHHKRHPRRKFGN